MKKLRRMILNLFSVLALLSLFGCKEELLHGLSENDANRLFAALHQSGISADKVSEADGKFALAVNSSEIMAALRVIDHSRIIKNEPLRQRVKGSFVTSRAEERFEFERNLSAEIERTISSISGVLESRVHLNLPPTDPLLGIPKAKEIGSASVLIIADADASIDIASITRLIAGAAGVPSEKVSVMTSVITVNNQPVEVGASDSSLNGLPSDQLIPEWPSLPLSFRSKAYAVLALIVISLGSIVIQRQLKRRAITESLVQKLAS